MFDSNIGDDDLHGADDYREFSDELDAPPMARVADLSSLRSGPPITLPAKEHHMSYTPTASLDSFSSAAGYVRENWGDHG